MSSPQSAPVRNQLLASLPPDVLQALLPRFTSVVLTTRQVIYTPDGPVEAVYFPESGMFSPVSYTHLTLPTKRIV